MLAFKSSQIDAGEKQIKLGIMMIVVMGPWRILEILQSLLLHKFRRIREIGRRIAAFILCILVLSSSGTFHKLMISFR